jgi:hypothetical protein
LAVLQELRASSARDAKEGPKQVPGAQRRSWDRPRGGVAEALSDDELIALLGAISAAAVGGERERDVLRHTADALAAPHFDQKRLRHEALALAQTLARAPEAISNPADPNYDILQALHAALHGLLTPSSHTSTQ